MTFNEKYKDNILLLKSFEFSLNIMNYSEDLQEKKKFVLASQILKSGTSIGANAKEAQNAESKRTLSINLRLLLRQPMKQNTGSFYATHTILTQTAGSYCLIYLSL